MQPSPTDPIDAQQNGLSTREAQLRLAADGPNELAGNGPRNVLAISRGVLTEPMFLLLLAAATIYIILGEAREAIALSASLVAIIAVTIAQERRTENALARLRDLSSPQALVLRDGMQVRVPGREVVAGDLIVLNEGDRVPADALLLSATALSIDESILTGESLPADKQVATAEQGSLAATDTRTRVFSGSLVVRGYGTARVLATGARTEIGKIGGALMTLDSNVTPLFREVRHIIRWVAGIGLLLCALIAVLYSLSHQDWLGGMLVGITVAMGILPEEFPVVLTVFLAMGAWRISRQGVLTRRMPAIESIGAVTLLAVDKTGTLTENRMRVAVIDTLQHSVDLRRPDSVLDEHAGVVLYTALGASELDAFDPMEHAIQEAAAQQPGTPGQHFATMRLIREYDLTPELLAVTHVWQNDPYAPCEIMVKGAPETVFALCHLDNEQQALMTRVTDYARNGLRVLAVAHGEHAATDLPDSPRDFRLRLLGLICLADPLRADVPARLDECRQAGIRVVMITGDHAGTALAIAAQAGIDTAAGALTGAEVAALSPSQLAERTRHVNVYARMAPAQKLSLVQALQANGEIVVMTGDGVNDAPALKAAHVGVAMGKRGTEVARAAASLVLVNDDFASLVSAVRLGRRIYANIRHAMSFIIAVHIPIAGLGLLPVLFNWPLLLLPLHIMFLEFVVDPACSFVFEADRGSVDLMRQPPRSPAARLFSRQVIYRSVLHGMLALASAIGVYGLALTMLPQAQARALAFVATVLGSVVLIFLSRGSSTERNAPPGAVFWWITALTLGALTITLYVPVIADLFHFDAPPWQALLAVMLAALLGGGLSLWRRASD